MSIRKAMWAIGVLASLSLGGCMLDATGDGTLDESVGQEGLELDWGQESVPAGGVVVTVGEDGDDAQGDDTDEPQGDGAEQDVAPANEVAPGVRIEEVTDPHPDPWMSTAKVVTPGHKD